ncbi:hypothetical protein ALQ56_200065 [Pseudomonas syringae pv. papulans]|nr:hypothetical protein ALQ56_200065 [Pseudomonas syringae pv. papulans]
MTLTLAGFSIGQDASWIIDGELTTERLQHLIRNGRKVFREGAKVADAGQLRGVAETVVFAA